MVAVNYIGKVESKGCRFTQASLFTPCLLYIGPFLVVFNSLLLYFLLYGNKMMIFIFCNYRKLMFLEINKDENIHK